MSCARSEIRILGVGTPCSTTAASSFSNLIKSSATPFPIPRPPAAEAAVEAASPAGAEEAAVGAAAPTAAATASDPEPATEKTGDTSCEARLLFFISFRRIPSAPPRQLPAQTRHSDARYDGTCAGKRRLRIKTAHSSARFLPRFSENASGIFAVHEAAGKPA